MQSDGMLTFGAVAVFRSDVSGTEARIVLRGIVNDLLTDRSLNVVAEVVTTLTTLQSRSSA